MKRCDRRSGMGIREGRVSIEAVHCLVVGDVELCKPACPIRSQLPKVHVERAVLLKHEEDVLDDAGIRGTDGNGCRCG